MRARYRPAELDHVTRTTSVLRSSEKSESPINTDYGN